MLATTTTACSHATSRAQNNTPPVTALRVAFDDAHARLDAALADLRTLVSHERLGSDDASGLEAEYVERHLRRVAALEERGALACTPDEWQHFTATAARRRAARRGAAARRARVRNEIAARECLVVAPGHILDPLLTALLSAEPDAEILEIRAELAAAQLLWRPPRRPKPDASVA